jgi:hypothetical protein
MYAALTFELLLCVSYMIVHVVCMQAAAAAMQQSVSLFYASPSMQAAAYVSDWDSWRANGVRHRLAKLDLSRHWQEGLWSSVYHWARQFKNLLRPAVVQASALHDDTEQCQFRSSSAASIAATGILLPCITSTPWPCVQVLVEPIYLEDLARPNECTLELSVRVPPCNFLLRLAHITWSRPLLLHTYTWIFRSLRLTLI